MKPAQTALQICLSNSGQQCTLKRDHPLTCKCTQHCITLHGKACFDVQGPYVITIVSPAEASVVIYNATNAVIGPVGAPGMANLTAAQAIPQGTQANFSIIVNATSQVPFLDLD